MNQIGNPFKNIYWFNVFLFIVLHIGALYGFYLSLTRAKLSTLLFSIILYEVSKFGITAGVHRLWSHRTYEAVLSFRILLAIFNSIAFQNSIYVWTRDHRLHHKYLGTDADPINSKRGLIFSHCGWFLCEPHPHVVEYGSKMDLTDLLADPVVVIQHNYYIPSVLIFCFALPTIIPLYLWNETLLNSFMVTVILRYVLVLNFMCLVNSAAHKWGSKPYATSISATDNNVVSILTLGEGFQNFHHSFPWDYTASEWHSYLNPTTFILDQLFKIGWVYDMRIVMPEMVLKKKLINRIKCEEIDDYIDHKIYSL